MPIGTRFASKSAAQVLLQSNVRKYAEGRMVSAVSIHYQVEAKR